MTDTKREGAKQRPLTAAMIRVLKNIESSRHPLDGFSGRSERGGANMSLWALHHRGYVTNSRLGLVLTDAGIAALDAIAKAGAGHE